MTKAEIIDLIKQNLIEIIPELEDEVINLNEPLIDMGANSIDRGELIMLTLEALEFEVPRVEFAGADTIQQLANLMEHHGNLSAS